MVGVGPAYYRYTVSTVCLVGSYLRRVNGSGQPSTMLDGH